MEGRRDDGERLRIRRIGDSGGKVRMRRGGGGE